MNMNLSSNAITELEQAVGKENLTLETDVLETEMLNTLGITRTIIGIVRPNSTNQVRDIVAIANKYLLPLHPISTGRNIGYGDKIPPTNGQLLVDLRGMNRIREYDPVRGHVVIEPGVTQKQLFDYLLNENAPWMMDVTGAGERTSIIGNTLEGGFGHTPLGDRRREINGLEAILGNGQLLKPTDFPNIGPDISGIFVQSNFGIVTAMNISLYPKPERMESFMMTTKYDRGLGDLVECVRGLRQRRIATSLVHIADPVRMLVTLGVSEQCRKENPIFTPEKASSILSKLFFKKQFWTALGGIYGSEDEVRSKKKDIRRAANEVGHSVMFFSDRRIDYIRRLGKMAGFTSFGRNVENAMNQYGELQRFMEGIPSSLAEENINKGMNEEKRVGLVWISPTFTASGETARNVYDLSTAYFREYGFELPLTITLVRPEKAVGIMNIRFDKSKDDERQRAHQLYHELPEAFAKHGIFTYRASAMAMEQPLIVPNPSNWEVFKSLKKALDPNGIISPGRYRIGLD
ncbi:MAG: FAD-binding oxidoreductase [archaeon]